MTIQELGLSQNLRVVEGAWVDALTKRSIEEFLKQHSEDVGRIRSDASGSFEGTLRPTRIGGGSLSNVPRLPIEEGEKLWAGRTGMPRS